ncbi:hypothetical protein UA08_03301 [Talaromyces atroroseus]|uniref:SWI/SNF family DNA-dependent ATPase Ris1 n=1 Tax=Talaromyces atroroseus TaxID=1441469 RepID=A0A225AR56_TALAT|nr:hypothetical protein UA08_03301 [Talaromyces atroroseus]OKL60854.1 hypothetical protein UA08_03301 [Talaromyces atroroseus]
MATVPDTASIEDILEDLELHQALLQSLIETRPGAIEQRKELEATVMDFERQLAQRRGVPYHTPPQQAPESPQRATFRFDGANDSSPARQGVNNLLDFFTPPQQRVSYQRKRPVQVADFTSPTGSPLSKRARSQQPASSPQSAMSPYGRFSHKNSLNPNNDPLNEFFALDGGDLEDFQAEQYEAAKWLDERRAQERRDEEFARRLQERLDQELLHVPPEQFHTPNKPHTGIEKTNTPMSYGPANTSQAFTHGNNQPIFGVPSLGDSSMLYRHPSQAPSPFTPGYQGYIHQGPSFETEALDSTDSDLAEISARDFYQSHTSTPSYDLSRNHSPFHSQFAPRLPPGLHVPTRLAPRPSDLHSRFQSRMSNHGNHDLGANYGLGNKSYPWLSNIKNENEYGIGSSLSLLEDEPLDNKQATQELKELLENIRPDIELSKNNREGTPKELLFNLYEHQKLGLTWMKSMEEGSNKGGILADDMGLGKTVQALSLIVSRPSTDTAQKTTLIIAPVALMQQWKREIERLLKPEYKLNVFVLHGEKRKTTFETLKKYDVVLTTFGTMASELKRWQEWDEQRRFASQNGANMIEKARSLAVLGPESTWYRVIIDEAQCIKNRNTKAAIACCMLKSTYRWCMSGTPMMNNVGELHSLLKFLRIRPYNSLELFNANFTKPLKSPHPDAQKKALEQIQVLLKAVLLRRTKFSKLDGKPLIDLPPRVTEKVHAIFSEDEQTLYSSLEGRTQIQFNKYLKAGTIGRNYSNILVLLLRLRQACCHPHLINDLSVDVSAVTESADFVENAKQFSPEVVRRLKENEPLECPVCIDAVENAVIFYPCGHATCAECFARISDPSLAVQQGNEGQVEVKCPNCRGKVDPKKVTDHLSFKKVHFPEQVSGTNDQQESNPAATEDSDDDSNSDDDSDEDDSDLDDFIVPDDYESDAKSHKSKRTRKSKGKGKGKYIEIKKPKKTLAVLRKEAQRNAASKRKYFKRLEKNWQTSAKIEKAIEILENTKNSGSGEKTIIFSQFTSLLDLVEVPIHRRGWKYRRYDGSMRLNDRNDSVLEFTDNPECDIMLVSLKAGNSGLNLVAASQVIIFDPFWNPYIEEQAIDRAHRLGQTRRVQIHRILVEKTVEDRILALQEEKREVIEGALDENAAKRISRLGERELKFLFNVR